MKEWETIQLYYACKLVAGYAFKSKDFGDYPDKVIKITHIVPPTVDMKNLTGVDLSQYERKKLIKYIAKQGDYVLAMTGATIGKMGRIEESEAYVNQRVLLFKNNPNVDKDYLFYVLQQNKFQQYILNHIDSESAQPNISAATVGKYEFLLPSLKIQNKIGKFLRLIDDKINVNNRINDNLEQQAQELFSNFYERATESVPFTSIIQILGGGTPKTSESSYWNGDIPFFTPKDVGCPYTFMTEKTITEDGLNHCNSRLYPVNTIFVTARGTVGKVGLSGVPMAMNQSCYALVGKDIEQLLVYFYTLETVNSLKHKASGAVFDAITTKDFDYERVMCLSKNDSTVFLTIVSPIFKKILSNCLENKKLAELRDSLLPKLMSGEIDVSSVKI